MMEKYPELWVVGGENVRRMLVGGHWEAWAYREGEWPGEGLGMKVGGVGGVGVVVIDKRWKKILIDADLALVTIDNPPVAVFLSKLGQTQGQTWIAGIKDETKKNIEDHLEFITGTSHLQVTVTYSQLEEGSWKYGRILVESHLGQKPLVAIELEGS